jgi:hypothetical protein
MDKGYWAILALVFFLTIVLTSFLTSLYVTLEVTSTDDSRRYCVVYGYATDYVSKQPVPNVTIMFFVGDNQEIPYTNATYWVKTDSNGFYVDIMPLYEGFLRPDIAAVKDGYYASPQYLASTTPTEINGFGHIQSNVDQFALYFADFQMIQAPNYTQPIENTPPPQNMTSVTFSKLDSTYRIWKYTTDPDITLELGAIEIFGGYGGNTTVTTLGYIPDRVDLIFFNGTNLAYTSYYPVLLYWTDPKIVEGTP